MLEYKNDNWSKYQMFNKIKKLFLTIFAIMLISTPATFAQNDTVITTKPLLVVEMPQKFLNKQIKMKATFDKFSTLGLDYKKALRPSTEYIGFLIQRDDVLDHNIPLSEMKLFIKRDYAEKFIELDTGDKIEITGKVFSTALGDSWIDVNKITILQKLKQETKK